MTSHLRLETRRPLAAARGMRLDWVAGWRNSLAGYKDRVWNRAPF